MQQWLPAAAADHVTGSRQDLRQASMEAAATTVAAHVLAGKPDGAEAFSQLLSLSARCAAKLWARSPGSVAAGRVWLLSVLSNSSRSGHSPPSDLSANVIPSTPPSHRNVQFLCRQSVFAADCSSLPQVSIRHLGGDPALHLCIPPRLRNA